MLSKFQEQLLVDRICAWAWLGVHLTGGEIRELALAAFGPTLHALGRPVKFSTSWLKAFLKRHRVLRYVCEPVAAVLSFLVLIEALDRSKRRPAFRDARRVVAASKQTLTEVWTGFDDVIHTHAVPRRLVLCMDETHVTSNLDALSSVIAPSYLKQPIIAKQEPLPHFTMLGIINATGDCSLPPVYIHPRATQPPVCSGCLSGGA